MIKLLRRPVESALAAAVRVEMTPRTSPTAGRGGHVQSGDDQFGIVTDTRGVAEQAA
ncbi:hypothetical protein ACFWBM_16210 [Streptomyces sp. NPDC059980]|uniref:hypothetical protein n=1 Tax=Streptomyces sp. NPDC059980 TaxID=3347022 RepID=UPI00369E0FCF